MYTPETGVRVIAAEISPVYTESQHRTSRLCVPLVCGGDLFFSDERNHLL